MVRAISSSLVVLFLAVAVGCGGGDDDEPAVNSTPNPALRAQLAQRTAPAPQPTPAPAAQPAAATQPAAAPAAQPAAAPASADSDEQPGGTPEGAANELDSFNAQLLADSAGDDDGNDESSGFEGMMGGMSEFDRALLADSQSGDEMDESTGFEALGGAPGSITASGVAGPGFPGAGGAATGRRPMPPGYKGTSMLAFRAGKNRDGVQYMLAHALTNEEGAAETLPTIQWVPGLRRPALAVHWGVAIQLIAPRKFDEDPQPIGSTQEFEGNGDDEDGGGGSGGGDFGSGGDDFGSGGSGGDFGSGGSGGDFGSGGGPGGAGDGTNDELSKYTGEFGEFVLEEIQARVKEGYFGDILRMAAMRGTGGGGGRNVGSGGPDSFGTPPGGGGPAGRSSRLRNREPDVENISAGVSFVGLSERKNAVDQLIAKAAKEGVDVLAIFRVTIKKNPRKEFITNDTVCSFYDPTRNERLVWTRSLSNVKVQRAREEEEDDGIEDQIIKLMSYTDTDLSMMALPSGLNNDNVQRRVSALASRQHQDMLEVLTEISFWNSQGLLSDQGKREAFQALLGDRLGSQLASGSEDEKKEAIEDWLPDKRTERSPFLTR